MKKAGVMLLLSVILILMVPFISVKGWRAPLRDNLEKYEDIAPVAVYPVGTDREYADKKVKVLVSSGEVTQIPLFEYLCGVLSGEMPASYETEALKAQCVAAFTYMVYRMEGEKAHPGLISEHKGAYVCTDYTHCKAYISEQDAISKWGQEWYNKYWDKIESAVSSVLGKVITYDSKPINAVFHSMSAGKTENARDVWGADIPYLVSVESLADKESSSYESTVTISETDFESALIEENSGCDLTQEVSDWIGEIERTEAGGIKSIIIGGISFKGEDIRRIFSLRSSNFDLSFVDGNFIFKVRGYGHGVGMSQNGANEMALEGELYDEILKYYYKGTQIVDYEWED